MFKKEECYRGTFNGVKGYLFSDLRELISDLMMIVREFLKV